jgi:hypothetical protein
VFRWSVSTRKDIGIRAFDRFDKLCGKPRGQFDRVEGNGVRSHHTDMRTVSARPVLPGRFCVPWLLRSHVQANGFG